MPAGMDVAVHGIRISHPDRVIYPELGFSKLDLVRYYDRDGDAILPHVADRPLTLVHCPDGLNAPCNYMRHRKVWGPGVLRRVRIREKTKVGEYLVIDDMVQSAQRCCMMPSLLKVSSRATPVA